MMKEVADDVWVVPSFPPHSINAWVAGDFLVDAQTRRDGKKILKASGRASSRRTSYPRPSRPSGRLAPRLLRARLPYWAPGDAHAAEDPS